MHNDWEARKQHFRALYRIFLMRVIDLEILSADGDPTRLIGQFATILSSISFLFALPILLVGGRRIPMTSQWTAEHFFLETTMTVAGLITILNWDSAFPDRRDVLVLGSLPVHTSTLFLAKMSAMFAAPFLAIVAFNIFSGVAWPLVFISHTFPGSLRAWPAYWATIFLAGGFLVFTVLSIQGLTANLLPRQMFLRVSALLQAVGLCLLLGVYFLEPSLESPAALTAPQNQRLLTWLPSYWFLGLFQQFNGTMHPALAPLARRAWLGLGTSALGASAALLLSYFRMLPKIVEQPDILPSARKPSWSQRFGSTLGGAITFFSLRTLLRSRQHRTILSFYLGIGLVIVLVSVRTPFVGPSSEKTGVSVTFLLVSLLMVMLTVLAIRVVAAIPIALRANWIFRVTQVTPARHYQNAIWFSWVALGVVPVLLVLAGGFLAGYPWQQILRHLSMMFLLGVLLIELCLYSFQKISFTCSYLPGKANIHFVFWACLVFLLRFLKEGAVFESHILNHLASWGLVMLGLALAAAGMRWMTGINKGSGEELLFEEEDAAVIVSLNLN